MENNKINISKIAIAITSITIIQKFLGFFREVILAYFYGTQTIVDAYAMANSTSEVLLGFIVTFSTAFLPIYSKSYKLAGRQGADGFSNRLITLVLIIGIALSCVCIVFASKIINFVAPGFSGELHKLSVFFLKITIWSMTLQCITKILTNYLNYWNHYILSTMAGLTNSLVQIIVIVSSVYLGNYYLGISGVFATLVHIIVLYVCVYKNGYKIRLTSIINKDIKEVILMVLPIFISDIISQINLMVDKRFASSLIQGSVSSLHYAFNIRTLILNIFSIAITTIIFPNISKFAAEKDYDSIQKSTSLGINLVIILFLPLSIGTALFSKQIIYILYEGGVFSNNSTRITAGATFFYAIGLLGVALRDVLRRVFYAIQYTKPLIFLGIVTILVNVFFDYLLIKDFGVNGLALATTISVFATVPILFYLLRKNIMGITLYDTFIVFVKSIIASSIMAIEIIVINKNLLHIFCYNKLSTILYISFVVLICVITYYVILNILKVKEINYILK